MKAAAKKSTNQKVKCRISALANDDGNIELHIAASSIQADIKIFKVRSCQK